MNDDRVYFPFLNKISEAGERRAVERYPQIAVAIEALLDEVPPFAY